MPTDPLFIGVYPCALVYADRRRERNSDYQTVARLPYSSLALAIEPDCPADLIDRIRAHAAQYHAGDQFRTSQCGQPITLGK